MYTTPYIRNIFHRTVKSLSDLRTLIAGTVSAYVQTYSTANRTVAAPTGVVLVDNSGGAAADGTIGAVTAPTAVTDSSVGTADGTLEALPNPTDTPATADALRDDLVAVHFPVLRNWAAEFGARQAENRAAVVALMAAVKELSTTINLLVADDLDNRQTITALIDDLQAAGLVS